MNEFKQEFLKGRESEPLLIYDLGSMNVNGSYRELFDCPPWRYRGIDVAAGENVDIVLENPYRWKQIPSGSADVLISGQALEHIEFFWATILEIARILKPDGICCLIAPSSGPEHRYPVDCWRFFPDGLNALARFARLKVVSAARAPQSPGPDAEPHGLWHDTVLICRKYDLSFFYSFRIGLWRRLLHWLMTRRLPV